MRNARYGILQPEKRHRIPSRRKHAADKIPRRRTAVDAVRKPSHERRPGRPRRLFGKDRDEGQEVAHRRIGEQIKARDLDRPIAESAHKPFACIGLTVRADENRHVFGDLVPQQMTDALQDGFRSVRRRQRHFTVRTGDVGRCRQELPVRTQHVQRISHQNLQQQRRCAEVRPEVMTLAIGDGRRKRTRRSSEKREDRLFDVAEVNADCTGRRQLLDDPPLKRIQVLHFVDLDPVKASIVFNRILRQIQERLVDEIVEVDRPKLALQSRIGQLKRRDNSTVKKDGHRHRHLPEIARRNAQFPLMRDQHRGKDVRVRTSVVLLAIRKVLLDNLRKRNTHRFANTLDRRHDADTMRFLQIGSPPLSQLLAQHICHLSDEIKLLRLVQHILARMDPPNRQQEPMADVMEIADIGERAVGSRRTGDPIAHLERRAVRERRTQHPLRIDARRKRTENPLRQHLRLPRSRRRQHEVAPRDEINDGELFVRKRHDRHVTPPSRRPWPVPSLCGRRSVP